MSLWVLGTDTNVGKTVTSAVILERYVDAGPIAYWKPISTGGDDDRDRTTLSQWVDSRIEILEESYLFDPPVSPHLAARLANTQIDPERVLSNLVGHAMADPDRILLIEAAGGVLVPITDDGFLTVRLVQESTLPAVVVARSALGTINHTLLTLEALRARRIEVAGVVINGPPNEENRRAIEKFGRVSTIVLPALDNSPPLPENIRDAARDFDTDGVLAPYFTG